MKSASAIRRTNVIEIDERRGTITKKYRNWPHTVIPQVLLGLRSRRALSGLERSVTEKLKIEEAQKAGVPLAQEYLTYGNDGEMPYLVAKYEPDFVNVEDAIKNGASKEEAFDLVKKCAQALRGFHNAGKSRNGNYRLIHGDPYLENFRVVGGSARLFDFEHTYSCEGRDALLMDKAIFLHHSKAVFRDAGHIHNQEDYRDLLFALEDTYPGISGRIPRGLFYILMRF